MTPGKIELSLTRKDNINQVAAKYISNLFGGLLSYASENTRIFRGFNAEHENGTALRGYYSEDFLDPLAGLVNSIIELADKHKISVFPAGQLWTPHTSIADLRYLPGTTAGTREDAFKRVSDCILVHEATKLVEGTEVNFDFLFGGTNIVLAASHLPIQIIEARRIMHFAARDLGMGEMDFANIVHITLARHKGVEKGGNLKNFGYELLNLHGSVNGNNLKGVITEAEIMPNPEMMATHERTLLLAATSD